MNLKISPPNSILFIFDKLIKNINIPTYQKSNILNISENCISIGTLNEFDGETTINFEKNSFDAKIKFPELHWFDPIALITPSSSFCVVTSANQVLHTIQTGVTVSSLLIGVNDTSEPNSIVICSE